MIETFPQAVKFLEGYIPDPYKKFPGELGLLRMRKLMQILGNPQDSYPTIHIGGTSGKGSTATFIASILSQKYKTGLHTSPHLVSIAERIRIGVKSISEEKFIKVLNGVIPALFKMEKTSFGKPTYFEIVTALAFCQFQKEKVDIAVIEVGMGGHYDATNVITKPRVAVITNVGLDHTEILGDTIEKIAQDKAGIIKKGMDVVSGATQPSIINIIKKYSNEENAQLSLICKDFQYSKGTSNEGGSSFNYQGSNSYKRLKLSLIGRYQISNAVLAIRVVECLQNDGNDGYVLSESSIRNGLSRASISGRFEIVSRKPLIILDGAHNQNKMHALMSSVRNIYPDKKITALLAIKADKRAEAMVKELIPFCDHIITTEFSLTTDIGETISYPAAKLQKIIHQIDPNKSVRVCPSLSQAIKVALKNSEDSLLLITGSLYLVGEVKRLA